MRVQTIGEIMAKRKVTEEGIPKKLRKIKKEVEKGHEFLGQAEGKLIVAWLNDPKRKPFDEVEQLIDLAVRYEGQQIADIIKGKKPVGEQIADLINNTVVRWQFGVAPVADFNQLDGLSVVFRPTTNLEKASPAQSLAFSKAIELLQAGLLTRVRRCKRVGCGLWFYAVFEHAIFHAKECRVSAVSSDPGFREKRKKYMRKLRLEAKLRKGGGKP
jgi:hypothetical protein